MTQSNKEPATKPGHSEQKKPASTSATPAASSAESRSDHARADAWDAGGSRAPGSDLPPQITESGDPKSPSNDPKLVHAPASASAAKRSDGNGAK